MTMLINEIAKETQQERLITNTILENLNHCKLHCELISEVQNKVIVETAAVVVNNILQKVKEQSLEVTDDVVDVLTVLYILQDPDNREALHDEINEKQFSVLVRRLGEDERVAHFLKRQAKHPSFSGMKEKVKKKLNSLSNPEEAKEVIRELSRMRMNYERVQHQIEQSASK